MTPNHEEMMGGHILRIPLPILSVVLQYSINEDSQAVVPIYKPRFNGKRLLELATVCRQFRRAVRECDVLLAQVRAWFAARTLRVLVDGRPKYACNGVECEGTMSVYFCCMPCYSCNEPEYADPSFGVMLALCYPVLLIGGVATFFIYLDCKWCKRPCTEGVYAAILHDDPFIDTLEELPSERHLVTVRPCTCVCSTCYLYSRCKPVRKYDITRRVSPTEAERLRDMMMTQEAEMASLLNQHAPPDRVKMTAL